jgi:hypothetical protein
LYGPEIDAYDEQLRAAEEKDAIANELIDQENKWRDVSTDPKPLRHVDDASKVRQQWESSETYQKIQTTRDYIM